MLLCTKPKMCFFFIYHSIKRHLFSFWDNQSKNPQASMIFFYLLNVLKFSSFLKMSPHHLFLFSSLCWSSNLLLCCMLFVWMCFCCMCACVFVFGGVFQSGLTPLHVAAHYDNQRVALLLLDQGASPHAAAKVSAQYHTHRLTRWRGRCGSVAADLCVTLLCSCVDL